METREVNGVKYYISLKEDVDPNEGGYYCQVYTDESLENEIDYFTISKDEDVDEAIDNEIEYLCEQGTGEVSISIATNGDVELYGDIWDCRDIAKILNVSGNIYINDGLYN